MLLSSYQKEFVYCMLVAMGGGQESQPDWHRNPLQIIHGWTCPEDGNIILGDLGRVLQLTPKSNSHLRREQLLPREFPRRSRCTEPVSDAVLVEF